MFKTDCPFCETEIGLRQKPSLSQRIVCSSCHGVSIVSSLKPLELDEMYSRDEQHRAKKKQRPSRASNHQYLDLFDEDDWEDEPRYQNRGNRNHASKRSTNHREYR